jgi:hypothetical protein
MAVYEKDQIEARRARRARLAGRAENVQALRAKRQSGFEEMLAGMNVPAALRKFGCDGEYTVAVTPAGGNKSRIHIHAWDSFDSEPRKFLLVRVGRKYVLNAVEDDAT